MDPKNGIMLKVLLNRYHRTSLDSMLQFLPQEYAKTIRSVKVLNDDPLYGFTPPDESLLAIHYSWLLPAISQQPEGLRNSFLAALPEAYSKKLRSRLRLPLANAPKIATPIKAFLINKLFTQIKPSGTLPIAYLPESPLSPLLSLDKQKLVEFIGFLGIYDLAESIRHIIDKNFLQKLYLCLSVKQKQFLRICLHQQEKLITSRMELSTWNGECDKLERMFQERGLLRLGKALCGQHPDFIWHLAHALDTGRGAILLEHAAKEAPPGITMRLIQQVNNLSNFLTPKSNP